MHRNVNLPNFCYSLSVILIFFISLLFEIKYTLIEVRHIISIHFRTSVGVRTAESIGEKYRTCHL
jgi:hypothetical protein